MRDWIKDYLSFLMSFVILVTLLYMLCQQTGLYQTAYETMCRRVAHTSIRAEKE